jgi:pimeloyl-ACP methyl ester carboxylesterase
MSALALAISLVAQDAAPPLDPELRSAVELCFEIQDDAKAELKIAEVAARPGLDRDALLRAVTTPPSRPTGDRFQLQVPFGGQTFPVEVVPSKQGGDGPAPVVLDLFWNTVASHFDLSSCALCWVEKYTPPEFSDEGRDSWRKILHSVSFALGGDPDRFWLTGFSWSGHAGYDVALHRPGLVRGFVALGGGPRRVHYRLFPNFGATRIVSCCGAKDDPELVWNLQEVDRLAKGLKLDWSFALDPQGGHKLPLLGMEKVAERIMSAPPIAAAIPRSGTLLADSDRVALPWLEIVEVDPAAVTVPDRIPVDATLGKDAQRRATIKAMSEKVARLDWKFAPAKEGMALELSAKGIRKAAVLVTAPWFDPAAKLQVVARGRKLHDGPVAVDAATLLREARRTGDRQRPTLMRIPIDFGR